MAVVTVKSTSVAGGDAPTPSKSSIQVGPRRVYEDASTVEVTNGDSIGSQYRMARVPSSARMSAVLVKCDAITTAVADFGIYEIAANGGAVVDADAFASAQALTAALVATPADVLHESGVFDISEIEQPLWQVLGLTKDPNKQYDIVATLTAAATGTGTLTVQVKYAVGN
jgi:hypothetical protein